MKTSELQAVPSLMKALEKALDHRQASGKRHRLAAVLSFMCCGMLCGAKSRLALFEWGRAHQPWCLEVFGFKQRTPCVNTLYWGLKDLDVVALEAALSDWVEAYTGEAMELDPIARDGKTVRGAKQQYLPGVDLLSAFARRSGTVLAQVAVGVKENEIVQALPLLEHLSLKGKVVTGDAMFTQQAICQHIVEEGGDYLLEVKGNQPTLMAEIEAVFGAT